MSLFDEIQSELIGETELSAILRKAKVLAYKLENQEFKDWIENELNGYTTSESLPKYRKVKTIAFGDFSNGVHYIRNHVIPVNNLAEEGRDVFNEINMFQGVKGLEAMIESVDPKDGSLMISIPSELYSLLHKTVFDNLSCLRAWRLLNKSQITQIIETTRNSLLTFILELAEKYPQIRSDSDNGKSIPDESVRHVFNIYVMGDNHGSLGSTNAIQNGGTMTTFDQRNQEVGTQYNAAGDITFNNVQTTAEFANELKRLRAELSSIAETEVIDAEIVTDADYQLAKAIHEVEKDEPNKTSLVEHLNNAKGYMDGVTSLIKVATAIGGAISAAGTLF
ncbi:MAG: hypothetical protein WKF34_03845 [Pyrinomonadaceae bacterium]